MHKNALEAKVAARNKANDNANKLWEVLSPIFEAWPKDKKAINNDGSLVAKLADLVSDTLNKFEAEYKPFQVYRKGSGFAILYIVRACEASPGRHPGDSYGHYSESHVYICETNGNFLGKLWGKPELQTDYSTEAIIEARQEAARLRKLVSEQENLYSGFGEHDN